MKDLVEILNTPFMLEIILNSLPKMQDVSISEASVKKLFSDKLNSFKDESSSEILWKKIIGIINSFPSTCCKNYKSDMVGTQDSKDVNLFLLTTGDIVKILPDLLNHLESELKKTNNPLVKNKDKSDNKKIINAFRYAFEPHKILRFDLYKVFINEIYMKQIEKLKLNT